MKFMPRALYYFINIERKSNDEHPNMGKDRVIGIEKGNKKY